MGHARCCDSQIHGENEKMRRRDSASKQRIIGGVWLVAKQRESKRAREVIWRRRNTGRERAAG